MAKAPIKKVTKPNLTVKKRTSIGRNAKPTNKHQRRRFKAYNRQGT